MTKARNDVVEARDGVAEVIEAWAGTRVRIAGAGAIGRALAAALAQEPGREVELYSRAGTRGWDGAEAGASVRALEELAEAGDRDRVPVVLCLSSTERRFIAEALAGGAAEVPRAVVARASVEALERDLPWEALAHAPVLVVTNPVELVCELVARRTGNTRVLGFGMATDRERVVEALARAFDVADPGPGLAVTGLHGSRAIPLLSRIPVIEDAIAARNVAGVARALARERGPHETAAGRAAAVFERLAEGAPSGASVAHDLLHLAVRAITAAEFDGPRPPVSRPVAVLARQVGAWLAGRADAVPGARAVSGPVVLGGARVFVGGEALVSGFAAPDPGPREAALLAHELDLHRAQVRELIGGTV